MKRECLYICFGLKIFNTHIYGRHVTVQNDYQSLKMTQHKSIHAASHLKWMHLRLQNTTTLSSTGQERT